MKVNRNQAVLKNTPEEDDDKYVDASPSERVAMVWELTAEVWSLKDKEGVERRLPRHITKLIQKED